VTHLDSVKKTAALWEVADGPLAEVADR